MSTIIKSLRANAATGLDDIDARTLREVAQELATALLPHVNECLSSGHFPTTFKSSLVTPIYKGKGNKSDCENYRPISIISNLAKIFEKLLYQRLLAFFVQENLLPPSQFGFIPGSNTAAAVLHAVNKIKTGLDNGKLVTALFLDISKAFDCVDHALLLEKLERLGVRGVANDLVRGYLFGRGQKVGADGHLSEGDFLVTGVPQGGSSLSTLLYLAYTDDMYQLPLRGYYQTFADDTAAIFVADSPAQLT